MDKVLLVSCEGLGRGGVQSVIMSIVKGLSDKFIFDIVLFTSEKRYYDDEFEAYGGKIFRIPHYSGKIWMRKKLDYYIRGPRIILALKKIIKKNGPYKVIHCNNIYESGLCLKAAKELIPIRICHAHVIASKGNVIVNKLNSVYKRYIEENSTCLVGCSIEANQSLYGSEKSSSVILNPYDNNRFNPQMFSMENRKHPRLIQIGYFCENKNQCFSIEILSQIKNKYRDAELVFIGFDTENYLSKMLELIEERKLQNNIKFYPQDADSPKLLAESDIFLLPSYNEGFGIVLIEAQAMGTRCYASNNAPKLTNAGNCMYIPLEYGPAKWAKIILDDFENKKERKIVDCSAFSMESFLKKIDSIYSGDNV